MRRLFRRAAQALLAAGALGLARPAAAGPVPVAAPPAEARPAVAADAARDRADEMLVELAWLGDAATFPYAFAARARDGALEVRGVAPTEAVKAKALAVAGEHTALPVVDSIQVLPAPAVRVAAGVPADEMQRGAARLLADALGDRALDFRVLARANGEVTLSGAVGSLKDKLAASRCLRQLHGCSCVVNRLTVAAAAPAAAAPKAKAAPAAPPAVADEAPPGPRVLPLPPPVPASAGRAAAPPAPSPAGKPDLLTPPALPETWSGPPKPKHAKPAHKDEFASEGVVHPPPAAAAPRDDRKPYTTQGVAFFEEEAPAPPPPVPAVAPAVLKQRVEGACGRRARGVQVSPRADGGLTVKVFIADEAARASVVDRVLRLPEMQGPGVRLDISVGE
jgi:hypothetical protein